MRIVRRGVTPRFLSRQLRELPTASVDCVVTSPPYYALRDYDVQGQIGLEANVDAWVDRLARVFDEVARVLKPTGVLWLNVADSYSSHPSLGAPTKGLLLAPERLLFALTSSGWLLRNRVIWAKPNPMPTSVADRLNAAHDFIYMLVRSPKYFFDLDAIREPHRSTRRPTTPKEMSHPKWIGPLAGTRTGLDRLHQEGLPGHALGKNPGDVWSIATRSSRGAHYATFPEELVRRPILSSCPEAVCEACGVPRKRAVSTTRIGPTAPTPDGKLLRRYPQRWIALHQRGPLLPSCTCGAPTAPGVVLDPFFGTGTVGVVAEHFGRDWVGIELNPAYVDIAEKRIARARAPGASGRQLRHAA